jgi:hypothetical protein
MGDGAMTVRSDINFNGWMTRMQRKTLSLVCDGWSPHASLRLTTEVTDGAARTVLELRDMGGSPMQVLEAPGRGPRAFIKVHRDARAWMEAIVHGR